MSMRGILLGFFLLPALAWPGTVRADWLERKLMVNGAGATFPYPLYSRWFSVYEKEHPALAFNYQSIGSGGGIRQLLDQTVDFGASDAPMSDEQLKKAKSPVLHIPATMGAVVLTYQKAGLKGPLKLSGEVIAGIFLGKITRWADPRIVELNPTEKTVLESPQDPDILVVHRADGSGTTSIFSEFLSKSSEEWKNKVGKGSALRWPTGIGGKGNEGVTSFIKQIPGSIGYVELVFAKTLGLPVASVRNARGEYIEPSPRSVTLAAEGALATIPDDFRASITLVPATGAYPISSFTYLLVYDRMPRGNVRTALFGFLAWALRNGQELSAGLNYAPLPKPLIKRVLDRLARSEQEIMRP
jgi:phosphate transport system substrate-binding protein